MASLPMALYLTLSQAPWMPHPRIQGGLPSPIQAAQTGDAVRRSALPARGSDLGAGATGLLYSPAP